MYSNNNDKKDFKKESEISIDPTIMLKADNQNDLLNYDTQRITSKEIDIESILQSGDNGNNPDGSVGATVIFIGTVRNFSDNGQVEGMTYESYIGMAEERIKNIETDVKKMWDIKKIKIIHRIGELAIGEKSIVIAISTSHSKDAFAAGQFILDKIKHDVPIWKNERLLDSRAKWVEGGSIKE